MTNDVYQWQSSKVEEITFLNKVYGLMAGGLFLTALTAKYVAQNVDPATIARSYVPCIIAELVLVFVLGHLATKASPLPALFSFVAYSILNGMTLSMIFFIYQIGSILNVFLTTALTFGCMSLYGISTKKDLTSLGSLCFMTLIGIIIAGIVNFFIRSAGLNFACSCLSVLVFVGLTAYDTQKIKQIHESGCNHNGVAIIAALQLYLDFVNLFLHLLQLFGKRRH